MEDARVDEPYDALEWPEGRRAAIEKKLAARHPGKGDMALYDVTGSCCGGRSRGLAGFGYDRDGKRKPIIVYEVMTDREGEAASISTTTKRPDCKGRGWLTFRALPAG